ncbi:ABC transporter substrate-binding protein [Candidatus Pacearchaeota archaeon]|nr:ABC transporter substrate-binding protein [Candidatus Pacearchaeota archaeon]
MEIRTRMFVTWVLLIILVISLLFNIILTGRVIFDNDSDDVIKIGGAFGLTGVSSLSGESELNGVRLAISEYNERGGVLGKKVELVVEDCQSDNVKTLSCVNKLINFDNVDVILGPTWLDSYGGAAPLADKHDILMMTPSASLWSIKQEKNYKNIYSTWYSTKEEAKALVDHLSDSGQKRVVLFFETDPFWQDLVDKIEMEEGDLKIIKNFKVSPNDHDFKTELIQIKKLNPDVVVFGLNTEGNQLIFLRQRNELYPESVLYSTEFFEGFMKKKEYKSLINDIYIVSPKDADLDFSFKYEEKYSKKPVLSAPTSYDATNIILKAISETGSTDASDLRDYINNNEFDSVTFGKIRFDDIGGVSGGEFVIKNNLGEIIEEL